MRRTAEGECQHAYSSFLKAGMIDEKRKAILSRATCQPRSEGFDFSRCYFNEKALRNRSRNQVCAPVCGKDSIRSGP